MKKIFLFVVAILGILIAGQSFACHISFEPEQIKNVRVGETVTIEAVIHQDHRRCVLEDDEVSVEMSDNIKIVKETGWERVDSLTLHNTFELTVLTPGDTMFRVFRECSKKGVSEGILEFQIQ